MSRTLDRLFALEAFGIKLGLDNMHVLADALGHPERAGPVVHVAGTNGKGSVCAMVTRALGASGLRTGLYTSPHLDRIEERVAVGGTPVDAGTFEASVANVLAAADAARADGRLEVSPTFFEVTTAAAFDVFRRAQVDIAIIEVGLGGRFDATNIVQPVATAITSIAMDHERHLGSTLTAIAGEKAGIAKPGVPLVVGTLPEEAMEVVRRTAAMVGAPIVLAEGAVTEASVDEGVASVVIENQGGGRAPVRLALAGRHQVANAATAVRLLEVLAAQGVPVTENAVVAGLTGARWPGRLEWLQTPQGRVLLDAAHNPAGAGALASYLRDAGIAPLPFVLAAMQDKDVAGMLKPLRDVVSLVVATEVPGARAWPARDLATQVSAALPGTQVMWESAPEAALAHALTQSPRAVVSGSIYLMGPLRARLLAAGAKPF